MFRRYLSELKETLDALSLDQVQSICDVLFRTYEENRIIFIFGNGGSAALASHMACDLGKGTHCPRPEGIGMNGVKRLKVFSVTDNVPMITAWANDSAYEDVFVEQIGNFIGPGDIAFGISSSGNSPNVLKALRFARAKGAVTVGLTGFEGGKMRDLLDYKIIVPSHNVQHVEDVHLVLSHLIFLNLRERLTQKAMSGPSLPFIGTEGGPKGGEGSLS